MTAAQDADASNDAATAQTVTVTAAQDADDASNDGSNQSDMPSPERDYVNSDSSVGDDVDEDNDRHVTTKPVSTGVTVNPTSLTVAEGDSSSTQWC